MAEEFHLMNLNDQDEIGSAVLEKNKKLYDIRKDGKRIWILCPDVTLKWGYSPNQYKDNNEGTVVIHMDDEVRQVIQKVDNVVFQHFSDLMCGKILNNVAMTPNALKDMFRSSIYDNTLRIYVSPKNCGMFKSDGSRIENPNYKTMLNRDLRIGVVIEPAFASFYENKLRVRWNARQIKLRKFTIEPKLTKNLPSLFDIGKPKLLAAAGTPVKMSETVSKMVSSQMKPKKSLFEDSDSDSE